MGTRSAGALLEEGSYPYNPSSKGESHTVVTYVNKLLLVLALICFVLAVFSVALPVQLVPLGLAFWVAAALVP